MTVAPGSDPLDGAGDSASTATANDLGDATVTATVDNQSFDFPFTVGGPSDRYVETPGNGGDDNGGANNCLNSGSPCATIQQAVDKAGTGDTVLVGDGNFVGGVKVTKDITIQGTGRTATTTITAPATALPDCDPGPNPWKGVVCVLNSNVTVSDLIVDGDGKLQVNGGGRFGGIVYFTSGGLVDNVEVTGVRWEPFNGVQGGHGIVQNNSDQVARTFTIQDSLVQDWQKTGLLIGHGGGPYDSNLDFSLQNTQVIGQGTTPLNAQNGLQLNNNATLDMDNSSIADIAYSGASVTTATGILNNSGGAATIDNSTFTNLQIGIYSYTFGADEDWAINNSTINSQLDMTGAGYPVNMGMYGFDGDYSLTGNNIQMNPGPGVTDTVGAYIEGGSTLVDATIEGNSIISGPGAVSGDKVGIYADEFPDSTPGSLNLSATRNRIVGSDVGLDNQSEDPIVAENNWWGCNAGPGNIGCDPVGENLPNGTVDFDPWLVMEASASSPALAFPGNVTIDSSIKKNSDGTTGRGPDPRISVPRSATPAATSTVRRLRRPLIGLDASGDSSSTGNQPGHRRVTITNTIDNQSFTFPFTITGPPATRYVATTGDDNGGANNCRVEASPCLTVAHAIDRAVDGDTVSDRRR